LLADTSGQNIVVSDSVTGNLTLRLQNVPWDQALDIVLRTKGLDKRRHDNVIIIGPTEELASREKAELAAHKEVQELSPIHTEFMQVNYAKVADLAPRTPCCRRAAACRSMNAPTPCWCRTPPRIWRISAAWCRPWTCRSGRY
jgi:hypothetical protein